MKMKRVLSLLLALVMSLALASSAFAQEVPVDKTSPTATADKEIGRASCRERVSA